MKVTVKKATRELTKKEQLVISRSQFEKIAEIIKEHKTCTIDAPELVILLECEKKDGGTFDQYVICGRCEETGFFGWYATGSASAGENMIELMREMEGEGNDYKIRIEYRQSRNDLSRKYYNAYII